MTDAQAFSLVDSADIQALAVRLARPLAAAVASGQITSDGQIHAVVRVACLFIADELGPRILAELDRIDALPAGLEDSERPETGP